jgi:translation initiation factor IF-1
MAKEETINMEGRVEEILPAAMFRIKLDSVDNIVLGRVEIEFTPYDLTRGRITRRK